MTTKLQHALQLAEQGFFVFPLHAGAKTPAITQWPSRATRNSDKITTWWTRRPDCNIAIATEKFGNDQALLVVDIDNKNGVKGSEAWALLNLQGDDTPATAKALTANNGEHWIYTVPEAVKQGAHKLGPGLDIRSRGGYIVAVGSTIDGKQYRWAPDSKDLLASPPWIPTKCGQSPVKPADTSKPKDAVKTNEASAVTRVIHYLKNEAKPAETGARNDAVYKLAARVKDMGIGNPLLANELISTFWLSRCENPLDAAELKATIEHTYQYGTQRIGSSSPEADFDKIPTETETETKGQTETPPKTEPELFSTDMPDIATRPPFTIEATDLPDGNAIPPREWLLGRYLLAEKVTVMIAPPGAGKSTFSLSLALACITGREDITQLKPHKRCKVLAINNEDDIDELSRRLLAVCTHFDIPAEALKGQLYTYSGVSRPFIMARRSPAGSIKPVDRAELIHLLKKHKIKLLIVDPFIETHQVSENSNEEIAQVARMYREVAVKACCAVLIVHHTRKLPAGSSEGHVGNMDSGRGASALSGVARVMVTLYDMSAKDAKEYGIHEDQRHLYVRLDDAKSNLSLSSYQPKWYKKIDVTLPNTDHVGVLEPAAITPVKVEIETEMREVAQEIVQRNNGEVPLNEVAQAILDSEISGIGESKTTVGRRLRKLLADKTEVAGWTIWYEEDLQKGKHKTQGARHWVYGHLTGKSLLG